MRKISSLMLSSLAFISSVAAFEVPYDGIRKSPGSALSTYGLIILIILIIIAIISYFILSMKKKRKKSR